LVSTYGYNKCFYIGTIEHFTTKVKNNYTLMLEFNGYFKAYDNKKAKTFYTYIWNRASDSWQLSTMVQLSKYRLLSLAQRNYLHYIHM
jgi:hypothetical protein